MSVLDWALNRPYLTAVAASVFVLALLLVGWAGRRPRPVKPVRERRRTPAAVRFAAFAAAVCTVYSADTSWRFADERLDIAETVERIMMFGAGEVALLACAQMARHNNRTTGSPGTPGTIIWLVTGVQVFAAYSISDFAGGTVRAILGPVMAVLLWHLAMGIDLRHAKPGTNSQALTAVVARELRERLLSRLGLAARDRTAEQITRDRATTRAVALAARLAEIPPEKRGDRRARRVIRRLSKAVGAAEVGTNEEQRQKLVGLLAARRHAAGLATVALTSPWDERAHAAADERPAERQGERPGERRGRAQKQRGASAQKSTLERRRERARELYDELGKRPEWTEIRDVLVTDELAPKDISRPTVQRIRDAIEKAEPKLAALGTSNVRAIEKTGS